MNCVRCKWREFALTTPSPGYCWRGGGGERGSPDRDPRGEEGVSLAPTREEGGSQALEGGRREGA